MTPLTPEQQAREHIARALESVGWVIQNRDEMNLFAGQGVAVREFQMAPGHGFADYLLFVGGGGLKIARQLTGESADSESFEIAWVEEALEVLEERFGIVRDLFHGFDCSGYFSTQASARLAALQGGVDWVCGLESPGDGPGEGDGKKRYLDAMHALNKAAGIALHLEGARQWRDEVGYFQAVQKNLQKYTVGGSGKSSDELSAAIRQIVSGAVTSEGVVDIFDAAGIQKPDISILSDEFLETLKQSPHRNLQLELLKKLLTDQVKAMSRRNVVQSRRFSEMLEQTLLKYQNRTLETAQVILELVEMAKTLRDTPGRGAKLGLSEDEMAFYDALVDHGNVKEVMGDEVLAAIAHDLVAAIRRSVTIDWTQKEAVRADLRRKVKRLLRKHGYPPDKRAEALITVIEQAEAVCADWAESPPESPAEVEETASAEGGAAAATEEVLPFRRVAAEDVQPFVNAVPLYDLEIAAGRFSGEQTVESTADPQQREIEEPGAFQWVELQGRARPQRGLFVARVVGESMNRRIPNGSWCLWRLHSTGTRQGRVVLAQHREIADSETGGRYTVKVYRSEKEELDDGTWRHRRIVLEPDSAEGGFEPIVFEGVEEGELEVVAELVEVLAW